MNAEQHRLVAQIRNAHKYQRPERVAEVRRDLAVLNAELYIRRLVAEAPPLTQDQRDRLAAILRPTAGAES